MVMKHAHKGAEHLAGNVEVDLLVVLESYKILGCEDLVDKLVDLLLIRLAALEGNLAGVVEAFAALAVVGAHVRLRVVVLLLLEGHIAEHDTNILLGHESVVVEVKPKRILIAGGTLTC